MAKLLTSEAELAVGRPGAAWSGRSPHAPAVKHSQTDAFYQPEAVSDSLSYTDTPPIDRRTAASTSAAASCPAQRNHWPGGRTCHCVLRGRSHPLFQNPSAHPGWACSCGHGGLSGLTVTSLSPLSGKYLGLQVTRRKTRKQNLHSAKSPVELSRYLYPTSDLPSDRLPAFLQPVSCLLPSLECVMRWPRAEGVEFVGPRGLGQA